jgi:hypothetical protein
MWHDLQATFENRGEKSGIRRDKKELSSFLSRFAVVAVTGDG